MRSLIVVGALIVALSLQAQDFEPTPIHEKTQISAEARFEIVQSTIVARQTFKLDKYTGRIWQLVKDKNGDSGWEPMVVLHPPAISSIVKPRFQLFVSGTAARFTYLLDVDTGQTWEIASSKDDKGQESTIWQPVPVFP